MMQQAARLDLTSQSQMPPPVVAAPQANPCGTEEVVECAGALAILQIDNCHQCTNDCLWHLQCASNRRRFLHT